MKLLTLTLAALLTSSCAMASNESPPGKQYVCPKMAICTSNNPMNCRYVGSDVPSDDHLFGAHPRFIDGTVPPGDPTYFTLRNVVSYSDNGEGYCEYDNNNFTAKIGIIKIQFPFYNLVTSGGLNAGWRSDFTCGGNCFLKEKA